MMFTIIESCLQSLNHTPFMLFNHMLLNLIIVVTFKLCLTTLLIQNISSNMRNYKSQFIFLVIKCIITKYMIFFKKIR
jgi:hypothetical protein